MVLETIEMGNPLVQIGITLLILTLGHLGVKMLNILIRRFWSSKKEDLTRKEVMERNEALRYLSYALDSAVIVVALLYLNTGINTGMISSLVEFLPQLVSAILLVILGILAINISTKVGADFLKTLGAQNYFKQIGLSKSALTLLASILKGFLYLILLQISLSQLGIGNTFIDELVTASSWAAAFLMAGLLFYGFKDLFQNYAAGIYLKNSRMIRPGEEIEVDDERGEIRSVSLFSTLIDTQSGKTVLSPNEKMMESNISMKRTKSDVETLEDIKDHFIAEKPEYAGYASLVMALDIFGYRTDQEEIAEKIDEKDPEETEEAVSELTESKVRTGFIEHDKITDLGSEVKTWFNDGALIITQIDKDQIFTDSEGEQSLLCVGAEGNEILAVDPGSKEGGVYYIDKDRLYESISSSENAGYSVIAPEGTTAFWRIKNGLLYSDKNLYDEISKTLESRLARIMRQGRILKDSMPSSVSNYIERWNREGDVARLWSPEEEG